MKRTLLVILLLVFAFPPAFEAKPKPKKKAKKPCAVNLAACSDTGCGGSFDPNLNKLKNITSNSNTPTSRTLTDLQGLANPSSNFKKGDPRDELTALGEGQVATVVAYLIAAKAEGGESCNCGLTGPDNTDNHLVLVDKATLSKATFKLREPKSTTMEITPRVRSDHPNWTKASLDPLISGAPKKALLVRIAGQLLFDSEHFLGPHLVRVNNWEIHPILGLEFCPHGKTCTADSDGNWKKLDDQ